MDLNLTKVDEMRLDKLVFNELKIRLLWLHLSLFIIPILQSLQLIWRQRRHASRRITDVKFASGCTLLHHCTD
jgi:hypothetical protein